MRLIKVPKVGLTEAETQPLERQLKLGWEDLILALALTVIVTSWLKGIFTPEQVLAYLGFTATGGMWGYVSGSKSK
jgi:hypothetical protein